MNPDDPINPTNGSSLPALGPYSDADFKRSIRSALRLVLIALAVGVPLVWWKLGWQSAALLAVGGLISGTGLFEWLRVMSALMERMDVSSGAPAGGRSATRVLLSFFLRLGVALALLYGSLKLLDGSVYALIGGLTLGVAALLIEGLRLVKSWAT
jgi:hypothetical protein